MSAAAHSLSSAAMDRRRIKDSLSGPIMARMAQLVPELAWLPRGRELEATLRDCDLLDRCFKAFRRRRSVFRTALLDASGRPVENDNTPLSCGRTVNQVVAMIVRSAAKRHFRIRLEGPRSLDAARLAPPRESGMSAMRTWMSGRSGAAPRPAEKSAADRLYDAVRRHLLHDWQVPIIPQYARLKPEEARRLGVRLLQFRNPDDLSRWLAAGEEERWARFASFSVENVPVEDVPVEEAAEAPMPAAIEAEPSHEPEPVIGLAALPTAPLSGAASTDRRARASELLSDDGRLLRMETVVPLLLRPDLAAALGSPDRDALRRAVPALAGTGIHTVRRLAVEHGLSAAQIIALLGRAALILPTEVYLRLFGRGADPRLADALADRVRAAGLNSDASPAAFAAFAAELLEKFTGDLGPRIDTTSEPS